MLNCFKVWILFFIYFGFIDIAAAAADTAEVAADTAVAADTVAVAASTSPGEFCWASGW